MLARGWSQSDLARAAGVSRQAVSLWIKDGADVRLSHLTALARNTGLTLDRLTQAPPGADLEAEAALLWDRLYPDLPRLAAALVRREEPALARLIEVYGLYRAERLVGEDIWTLYPGLRARIRPPRREQLDRLWRWQCGRN